MKKTFIFDFDSTIFPGETLDEIISFALRNDPQQKIKSREISKICNLGMSGEISMAESLRKRLEIAAPTREIISEYVVENKNRIDSKFRGILKDLQESGHEILVVSGGFEEWIIPLLDGIIPAKNIHANKIKNHNLPMTFDNIIQRSKEEIIKSLNLNPREIFMIGDGMTDFSVFEKGLATNFVGCFFYQNRPLVREKAEKDNSKTFGFLNNFIEHMKNLIQ
jgi:D-3-phosphoglycerate dehydrogenase